MDLPVQVTHAGNGSDHFFIVEQRGRISIVQNGVVNSTPFLDISDQLTYFGERGLMNIACPPNFTTSQQFYVSFTNLGGDLVLSRISTSDDGATADQDSEEILLAVSQPHRAHNGGSLAFGPNDGYLYVAIGDGGSEGRPVDFPQDPQLLLGKTLRLDVESGAGPNGVPATNPYIEDDKFSDEIWALGLRNPWGFAFDSHTGDFYTPDAGHNDREELNVQPATSVGGENYGWPTIEGTRCPKIEGLPYPCSQAGIFDPPVAEFDHTRGCAIVGGVFYRGSEFPQLRDRFLFADFCLGDIWSLQKQDSLVATGSSQKSHGAWHSELVLNASLPVSSIGTDEDGNLYVTGYADGTVYLITQE
ncbi:MAG: PQQ-dependent sugar dehydrogenase [Caldilineaceae bacterium]|nr:PQQ-dependent sugar dehydrogenase [Caldilineaceae bacterium]